MNITIIVDDKLKAEEKELSEAEQKKEAAYHFLIDVCDKTRLNEGELMERLNKEVNDKNEDRLNLFKKIVKKE